MSPSYVNQSKLIDHSLIKRYLSQKHLEHTLSITYCWLSCYATVTTLNIVSLNSLVVVDGQTIGPKSPILHPLNNI